MARRAHRSLLLLLALSACDDAAQPRPPQPDGSVALDAGGRGGSGGSSGSGGAGGSAGAGSGGTGGTGGTPCEGSPAVLLPDKLPAAMVGTPYSQELWMQGATAAQVGWITRGALPGGLVLVENSIEMPGPPPEARAVLSGVPTTAGTFNFNVSASLLVQPMCGVPPAQRDYELVVDDADADAGAP
jgi:hypothetical protein